MPNGDAAHTARHQLLPFVIALTVLWTPALPALACGELPDVEITIVGSSPAEGASEVPPDAPLLFDVRCELDETWLPLVSDAACRGFADRLEFELHADGESALTAGRSGTIQGS